MKPSLCGAWSKTRRHSSRPVSSSTRIRARRTRCPVGAKMRPWRSPCTAQTARRSSSSKCIMYVAPFICGAFIWQVSDLGLAAQSTCTPGFWEYHRRMQIFILLYIEGGSYINEDEDSWEFVVLCVFSLCPSLRAPPPHLMFSDQVRETASAKLSRRCNLSLCGILVIVSVLLFS